MDEIINEVEMVYIQNTHENNFTLETMGRRSKNFKLNFSKVEGIEINSPKPIEIKNSLLQMTEGQTKVWNMRFSYPITLQVKFMMGKIVLSSV